MMQQLRDLVSLLATAEKSNQSKMRYVKTPLSVETTEWNSELFEQWLKNDPNPFGPNRPKIMDVMDERGKASSKEHLCVFARPKSSEEMPVWIRMSWFPRGDLWIKTLMTDYERDVKRPKRWEETKRKEANLVRSELFDKVMNLVSQLEKNLDSEEREQGKRYNDCLFVSFKKKKVLF